MSDELPARRRHRWITVPSGVALFACLFLPAIEGCSSPIYPVMLPPVYPPYVLGLIVAIAAASRRASVVRGLVTSARVIVWLVATAVMLFVLDRMLVNGEDIVVVPVVLGAVGIVVAIIGFGTRDELAAARMTMGIAVLGILWFGMWFVDGSEDLLFGLYVSVGSSLALLVGGLEWRREIVRDRDPVLPAARVR